MNETIEKIRELLKKLEKPIIKKIVLHLRHLKRRFLIFIIL